MNRGTLSRLARLEAADASGQASRFLILDAPADQVPDDGEGFGVQAFALARVEPLTEAEWEARWCHG